ncbi:MAG: hypothetical protein VX254_05425, partial [Planctomycetota bacterium]|nr:hypothetical protein [Planctomycetota bacterium]
PRSSAGWWTGRSAEVASIYVYEHTIRPNQFNYKLNVIMVCLSAAAGVVLELLSVLSLLGDSAPGTFLLWLFFVSALYACWLPVHGLTVRVSAEEVVESYVLGIKAKRFPVSGIIEPAIVKTTDDFDLVQFKIGDGYMGQFRTDEPEELLAAIESVISAGD